MPKDEIRIIRNDVLTDAQKASLTGAIVLDPDTWDAAIIGVHTNRAGEVVAVYDEEAIIDIVARGYVEGDDELDEDDARQEAADFVSYNTGRSLAYMGPRAPILASEPWEDMEADWAGTPPEEMPEIVEFGGRRWVL